MEWKSLAIKTCYEHIHDINVLIFFQNNRDDVGTREIRSGAMVDRGYGGPVKRTIESEEKPAGSA